MGSRLERTFARILATKPSSYPFVVFWLGILTSWLCALFGFFFIHLNVLLPWELLPRLLLVFFVLLFLVSAAHRLQRGRELDRIGGFGGAPPHRHWSPAAAEDLVLVLSFPGRFALSTLVYSELVVALFVGASLVLFADLDPGRFQITIIIGGQIATAAAVLVGYSMVEVSLAPLKSRFPPIEDIELIDRVPRVLGYRSRVFAAMMVLIVITGTLVGSLVHREFQSLHPMPPDIDAVSLMPELVVIGVFTLAFGGLLALTASGVASRLIQDSLETVKRLGAGDLSARATVVSAGDLGALNINVNSMARRMQETITELKENRRALEEAERQRAELVAHLTHDIRSPIASIMASSQIGEVDAQAAGETSLQRHFLLIRRNAKRVADLAKNIMDMEQLERSQTQLDLGYVDLAQLADELLASMASLVGDRDLSLRSEVPTSMQLLLTDREKLTRILDNLLANAIRVTKEGEIIVRTEMVPGNRVSISVIDSGPGISPEDLEHLFEPRFQVAGVPRGGAGLGLPISRRFATLLGGQLQVKSVLGEGAAFVLELPSEGPPVDHPAPAQGRTD